MREAVAIEESLTHLSSEDMVPGLQLISYCADLVLLDQKGYVQMLHASLKQVLQGNWAEHPLLRDLASPMVQSPEIHLADSCLSYLLLDDFALEGHISADLVKSVVQAHPFLPYASRFWATHVKSAVEGVELMKDKIIRLITDQTRMNLLLFAAEFHDNPHSKVSIAQNRNPLHFVAENGLQDLFEHFEDEIGSMSDVRDTMGLKPLDLALQHGHHVTTLRLLDVEQEMKRWQTKQDSGSCRLHSAIRFEWQDVVEVMLSLRASLSEVDEDGMAPLHVASCGRGPSSIMQTLLDAEANIEQVTFEENNTCLMLAAETG